MAKEKTYTRGQVEEAIQKLTTDIELPTAKLLLTLSTHEGDSFTAQKLATMFDSIVFSHLQFLLDQSTYGIDSEEDRKRLKDQVGLRARGPHGQTLREMIAIATKNKTDSGMIRILDAGAGPGRETVLLAELFDNVSILGVENQPSVEKAREFAARSDAHERIQFLQQNLIEKQVATEKQPAIEKFNDDGQHNNEFDIINASALCMWAKPKDIPVLLTQLWNCLKPGGEALFSDAYQFRNGEITNGYGPTIESIIVDGLGMAPNVDVVAGIPGQQDNFLTILKNFGFEIVAEVEEHFNIGGQDGHIFTPLGGKEGYYGLEVARQYAETIANRKAQLGLLDAGALETILQKINEDAVVLSQLPHNGGGTLSYMNYRVRRPAGSDLKKMPQAA